MYGINALVLHGPHIAANRIGAIGLKRDSVTAAVFYISLPESWMPGCTVRAEQLARCNIDAQIGFLHKHRVILMTGPEVTEIVIGISELANIDIADVPVQARIALWGLSKVLPITHGVSIPKNRDEGALFMVHQLVRYAVYVTCGHNLPDIYP